MLNHADVRQEIFNSMTIIIFIAGIIGYIYDKKVFNEGIVGSVTRWYTWMILWLLLFYIFYSIFEGTYSNQALYYFKSRLLVMHVCNVLLLLVLLIPSPFGNSLASALFTIVGMVLPVTVNLLYPVWLTFSTITYQHKDKNAKKWLDFYGALLLERVVSVMKRKRKPKSS